MQFIKIINKNIITFLVFFAIFLCGIFLHDDYGLTLDDEIYRQNGALYYDYVKSFFFSENLTSIENSEIYTHPAIFEFFLAMIADLANITEIKKIFQLSHFLNFMLFFISLIFFYKILQFRFHSKLLSILGVVLLIITPRIFSESFYNSRDIFFLSLFIFHMFSLINLFTKPTFYSCLLFSISTALIIDAKVMGIISPLLIIFFIFLNSLNNMKFLKRNFTYFTITIALTSFFILLFWPYLWSSPINNIYIAFNELLSSHNNTVLLTHYLGEYISSDNTPWHYRPLWFFITTPVIVIFLFSIGIYYLFIRLVKRYLKLDKLNNTDVWKGRFEIFDLYCFLIILLSFFITIKFNTSQFNSWRHLYFLYPMVIYISLYGFYCINFFLNFNAIRKIFLSLIAINLIYLLFWNIKYHPFQNFYFNIIAKNYVQDKFDYDYWGLSNTHALNFIAKSNNKFPVKVATISFSDLNQSLLKVEKTDRNKIIIVHDPNEADFLITNYMKKFRNNFFIDETKHKKYYELVVDKVVINTIYKK